MCIRDSASTLLLTLEFPAADAANFTVGQAAQVTLDGTFEAVSGTCLLYTSAAMPQKKQYSRLMRPPRLNLKPL